MQFQVSHISTIEQPGVLELQKGRQLATPGERILGALLPNRTIGWPGGWSQDRAVQVMHFRNWAFIGTDAICSVLGQLPPNLAYVYSGEEDDDFASLIEKRPSASRDPRVDLHEDHRDWSPSRPAQWSRSEKIRRRNAEQMHYRYRELNYGGSHFSIPSYYNKALSVIRPHEEIKPLERAHLLRRLIENPNPMDTTFDLLYELGLFLCLCGVSYLWCVPNDWGQPAELWVIPAHWVWPRTGGSKYVNPKNPYAESLVQYYEIRPWGGLGGAGALHLPPDQVIMFPWKSPINKLDGFSRMQAIAQWIDVEESISKSRWAQMMNQARSELWIELGADFEDPDDNRIKRLETKFMNKYAGEFNYGKPIFGPPGAKATPLTFSPAEMAYAQSEEQIRDQILSGFRVPAAAVGLVKDLTYGSILATLSQFCVFCINPILTMIGQRLTKYLGARFSTEEEQVRIWWDDCSPPDPQQLNSDINTDASHCAITTNEIRALRGRAPFEFGGDDPMVQGPGGMVPLPLNTGRDYQELGAKVPVLGQQPAQEGAPVQAAPGGVAPPVGPEGPANPGAPQVGTPGSEGGAPGGVQTPEPGDLQLGIEEPNGAPQKLPKKGLIVKSYFGEAEEILKAAIPGESYFRTCPRDESGHCLPQGSTGAVKPTAQPKPKPYTPPKRPRPGPQVPPSNDQDAHNLIGRFGGEYRRANALLQKELRKAGDHLKRVMRKLTKRLQSRYSQEQAEQILTGAQKLSAKTPTKDLPSFIPKNSLWTQLPAIAIAECHLQAKTGLANITTRMEFLRHKETGYDLPGEQIAQLSQGLVDDVETLYRNYVDIHAQNIKRALNGDRKPANRLTPYIKPSKNGVH